MSTESPTTIIGRCLACDSSSLRGFLDLGEQPLANAFHTPDVRPEAYPLALNVCEECFHSQLSISVSPEELFRDYVYVSGTSTTLINFFEDFAELVEERYGHNLKVIELASNDGSLLSILNRRGHTTLGIDPAANLVAAAAANGVNTLCAFWPSNLAQFLQPDVDLIVAMNVLAHVPDPLSFLIGVREVMNVDSTLLVQTSQANMITNNEFDTAYHEHLSFFNVMSMTRLLERAGLTLRGVSTVPVHGESYLWEIGLGPEQHDSVQGRRVLEEEAGVFSLETYRGFGERAEATMVATRDALASATASGLRAFAYGAAAKGNTFLNASGIVVEAIVDDNPAKQGLLCPGSDIPVVDIDAIAAIEGDCVFLVPAWNFREEIRARLAKARPGCSDQTLAYFPTVGLAAVQES